MADSIEERGAPKEKHIPSGQKKICKDRAEEVIWEIFQTIDRPLFAEDVDHYVKLFSEKKFNKAKINMAISYLEEQGFFDRIGQKYTLKENFLGENIPMIKEAQSEAIIEETEEVISKIPSLIGVVARA